ncbi:uncharacterized protein BXZ73DRAFT_99973 [Epithele typhae]|uniref:uncharacterized protein n=1 Tax=Epithele typhae TaxID=378194 RepID=UPI002007A422|nr:uncharacterized protein BXZ73DRAFT_99973 [Epithele typhae]KAH9938910.1 hypothetical protein BXZ73DRAFT_99973 [Epithele typhae]
MSEDYIFRLVFKFAIALTIAAALAISILIRRDSPDLQVTSPPRKMSTAAAAAAAASGLVVEERVIAEQVTGTPTREDQIDELRREQEALRAQLRNQDALQESYNELRDSYDELRDSYDELRDSYDELRNSHDELQRNYRTLTEQVRLLLSDRPSLRRNGPSPPSTEAHSNTEESYGTFGSPPSAILDDPMTSTPSVGLTDETHADGFGGGPSVLPQPTDAAASENVVRHRTVRLEEATGGQGLLPPPRSNTTVIHPAPSVVAPVEPTLGRGPLQQPLQPRAAPFAVPFPLDGSNEQWSPIPSIATTPAAEDEVLAVPSAAGWTATGPHHLSPAVPAADSHADVRGRKRSFMQRLVPGWFQDLQRRSKSLPGER